VAIKHQDIKNLVMQELLNESINNEGVADWLKKQSSKFLSGAGKTLSGAGEKLKPGDPNFVKKLDKIGDFLQDAQRDKDITAAIMQTELGKKVFSSQEKSLEEALGQDFAKMMKDKKVTPQEVSSFISAMSKNKKAKQMLDGLGIEIEVGDQDVVGSSPADSAPQTPAGSATTVPTNGATPPPLPADASGANDVIAVFKGKTKGPKGTSDSLHTQLTRQFKNIPDSGKLITAISKDLLNQLKVNGLKVQESAEQVEQFLLKELIDNKLEHQSLSYLLKENNSLDYRLTSQILESIEEVKAIKPKKLSPLEKSKAAKASMASTAGDPSASAEIDRKKTTTANAVELTKQLPSQNNTPIGVKNPFSSKLNVNGSGEKDLGGAAAVQNAKDAEQNNTAAARQLAADTNPNSTPDAQRTQDSVIPQPAPDAPASVSSEKPKDLGNISSGDSPGANYATNGFDDKQKRQLVSSLIQKGFKQVQVTKLVNGFSDWLKNRTKQQQVQPVQEGAGNSQVRELISQFIKETNFAADENLRAALADQTIRTFGNPAKAMGPVRANTSATAGKMPDISQAAKTMGAGVAQKEPAQAQPTSGPKQSGQMVGRQQQISKAADAAFKMTTPAKAGFVNVGEVVGRKLKAMAQLNAKSGAAIIPLIPKILKAIEGFLNYALSKSGKKNVKILGGIKNAAALQKTVQQASQGSKAAIPAGVDIMKTQQKQKAALKEALVQEIFNLLIGKTK
jgi:hypothetical protein